MSLISRNSKDLVDPAKIRLKILLFGLPGSGKTSFVGTVPNVGIASCETGHGSGILSIAQKGVDFVEPTNYKEFEAVCSGDVFKEKSAIAVDSLSAMARTFIKDYAIANFPRARGETPKRRAGIPELDDYQTIAELTRRLLAKLLSQDKHIIVTATLKLPQAANPDEGKEATPGQPDLPGQLALASAAMFDLVMCLRHRPSLRDAKDAKTRFNQRYWLTQGNEQWVAKSRLNSAGLAVLDAEEIFDLETGAGSFPYILEKIQKAYAVQV